MQFPYTSLTKTELAQLYLPEFTAAENVAMPLLIRRMKRTEALGQWCQGFLHGFGVNAGGLELSTDAKEVLQDLAAISQVQDALEESEDGEADYMEVQEYLRVAPLLLFSEFGKVPAPAEKPSLH